MAKDSSLRVGSTLFILGILALMFGLLMTLHQTTIVNYVSNIINDLNIIELIGVIVGLLGSFLVTTGFTMSVSSIIEAKLENERSRLISGLLPTLQDIIANTVTSQMQASENRIAGTVALQIQSIARPQKCKFCGTQLGEGDTFCPSCGKSQM